MDRDGFDGVDADRSGSIPTTGLSVGCVHKGWHLCGPHDARLADDAMSGLPARWPSLIPAAAAERSALRLHGFQRMPAPATGGRRNSRAGTLDRPPISPRAILVTGAAREPGSSFEDFLKVDVPGRPDRRSARPFQKAPSRPSNSLYRHRPEIGRKKSSAQITKHIRQTSWSATGARGGQLPARQIVL
jgi:hypothetical protein